MNGFFKKYISFCLNQDLQDFQIVRIVFIL
jgi:hypothetical protein